MSDFVKKVIEVQAELKAPKNQTNSFGGYKYRNLEDIEKAVKPLLYSKGLLMLITDEIIEHGGRLFVEATACLTDGESSTPAVKAQAEIGTNKKMAPEQRTGSASSYARKYAVSGLFLIDDTKDADNFQAPENATKEAPKASKPAKSSIFLKINSEAYGKVIMALKSGKFTIDDVMKKYYLSDEVLQAIKKVL